MATAPHLADEPLGIRTCILCAQPLLGQAVETGHLVFLLPCSGTKPSAHEIGDVDEY